MADECKYHFRFKVLLLICLCSIQTASMELNSKTRTILNSPSKTVDIHIDLCGGMFNCHLALSAVIWMLTQAKRFYKDLELRLFIPPLDVSHGTTSRITQPFSYFYDLHRMTRILNRIPIHLFNQTEKCDHVLPFFGDNRTHLATSLRRSLRHWHHHCAFIVNGHVADRPGWAPNCSFYFVDIHQFLPSGQGMVSNSFRFHPRLKRIANLALRKLPKPFYAIHLRIEAEALRVFMRSDFVFSGPAFSDCLLSQGWNSSNTTLYISAGVTVYRYPEFREWMRATPNYQLVTLSNLLPNLKLPREERGIVEALICAKAVGFAGFSHSSRSLYIMTRKHRHLGWGDVSTSNKSNNGDMNAFFHWNRQCPLALQPLLNTSSEAIRERWRQEYGYLNTQIT